MRFAILGLGGRGREAYAGWILRHPERAQVVAVADPVLERHDLELSDPEHFTDWHDMLDALPRVGVDAAIVALPDNLHVEPVVRLLKLGLPTLLEKPIAPTLEQLNHLVSAVEEHNVPITVAHVLRFTPFWQTVHQLVKNGSVGEVVTLEIRENIGFWHFAHSYVRGNWRNAASSSPMVLSKTCHDLDLIRWLMGRVPESIYSSGGLKHFNHDNRPAGAPDFCIEGCPVEDSCPFYAPRYYVDALAGVRGVPVTLLTSDTSASARREALTHSDYGRCVYGSDNDVADHQATLLQFSDGAVASLIASAFTAENSRHLMITGTRGQISGNMETGLMTVDMFSPTGQVPASLTPRVVERHCRGPLGHDHVVLLARPDPPVGLHAGGDDGLMDQFVTALERGVLAETPSLSIEAALDSHYMAFAAEESRLSGKPVEFSAWQDRRRASWTGVRS